MKIAVVVFVKTLGLSSIKTRLRTELGEDLTDEFYTRCIDINRKFVLDIKSYSKETIEGYWAIAEKNGFESNSWLGLNNIYQGPGNLGTKLDKVYSELIKDFDIVLFMGSDSPQLESINVNNLIEEFVECKSDFLIGKAIDGGFYLFGGKVEIEKELWTSVQYSSEFTCAQLIENLERKGQISLIEENFDIDTFEDLLLLTKVNKERLSLEQKSLIYWVNEILLNRKTTSEIQF
jgi:glycosyltransferase A (GT-A) superfamily protein (DUF2064 family)